MTTRGIMAERIQSELRRDDLITPSEFRVLDPTSDIVDAINAAIRRYEHMRFYFSQSRSDIFFPTVIGQDIYTQADLAAIARITHLRYGFVYIGGNAFRLYPAQADRVEGSNSGANSILGTPGWYTWFAESIRLEPIPNGVFSVRFGATMKIAAPANDSEAGNRWMIDAELLIRSRAKAELYRHVIKNYQAAGEMQAAADDALAALIDKTEEMTQTEEVTVEAWNPYQ